MYWDKIYIYIWNLVKKLVWWVLMMMNNIFYRARKKWWINYQRSHWNVKEMSICPCASTQLGMAPGSPWSWPWLETVEVQPLLLFAGNDDALIMRPKATLLCINDLVHCQMWGRSLAWLYIYLLFLSLGLSLEFSLYMCVCILVFLSYAHFPVKGITLKYHIIVPEKEKEKEKNSVTS